YPFVPSSRTGSGPVPQATAYWSDTPGQDPHATAELGADVTHQVTASYGESEASVEAGDADASATGPAPKALARGRSRYRIVRPPAKGGLGAVFVALDSELNREVALKEIQIRHADDPVSRARFVVEAEVTGGLEHPGIVPVYGLGQYVDG